MRLLISAIFITPALNSDHENVDRLVKLASVDQLMLQKTTKYYWIHSADSQCNTCIRVISESAHKFEINTSCSARMFNNKEVSKVLISAIFPHLSTSEFGDSWPYEHNRHRIPI